MSTHDPRRQAREIREALQRYEREQLIDILTHLFSHYVLDGSAAEGGAARAPALSAGEFQGLSFAQVVERLQLRLPHPELALLEVQRGQVSVRVEGRLVPLRSEAAPALEPPRRPPGVTVEVRSQPAAPAPPAADARPPALQIPRATGVTVSGRSVTVEGGTRQPPAAPGMQREELSPERAEAAMRAAARGQPVEPARPATPAAAPRPAAAPAAAASPRPAAPAGSAPAAPEGSRFSLLEID